MNESFLSWFIVIFVYSVVYANLPFCIHPYQMWSPYIWLPYYNPNGTGIMDLWKNPILNPVYDEPDPILKARVSTTQQLFSHIFGSNNLDRIPIDSFVDNVQGSLCPLPKSEKDGRSWNRFPFYGASGSTRLRRGNNIASPGSVIGRSRTWILLKELSQKTDLTDARRQLIWLALSLDTNEDGFINTRTELFPNFYQFLSAWRGTKKTIYQTV